MPTPAQVQAQSPRSRCTDVLARFSATALDVATAGDSCALHLHTLRGTLVVVLPLEVFAEKCRGSHDCNQRPLPALRLSRAERLESAPVVTAAKSRGPYLDRTELRARAERAWALLDSDLTLSAADAAAAVGLTATRLSYWISLHHRGELQQRRRAAGLPVLARCRPANLATAASRGEPLRKPGGGL